MEGLLLRFRISEITKVVQQNNEKTLTYSWDIWDFCNVITFLLANTKGTKRSRTRTDSYTAGQSVGESVAMTTINPQQRGKSFSELADEK